jgi:uncharacterized repeat protein (TIGR03803 family)
VNVLPSSAWITLTAFRWAAVLALGCLPIGHVAGAPLQVQVLHAFGANPHTPQAGLVRASDGNFYGCTYGGGTEAQNGTIFRITPDGAFTSLFLFNGTNGSNPAASLIEGRDGGLYGTTQFGGVSDNGTIFRITRAGAFTSLFSFRGTNGSGPSAALMQGSDGAFYGTTRFGGIATPNGTVFKITSNGVFTLLFSFPSNGRSGIGPTGSLIEGSSGIFHGTTAFGGASADHGTIFRITSAGAFTSQFSFSGANGSSPAAGLALGTDGNFYGTTQFGGATDNGTVFRFTPTGTLTPLYSFRGPDGNYPVAGLTRGADGNFYGTTSGDRTLPGGINTFGTIFRITPAGALTTLAIFNGANGASPVAGLTLGLDGNFYGTTFEGGAGGGGTVFRLVERPTITAITRSGGNVIVTWTSFNQGRYLVEFTPSLVNPSWTALAPEIVATSTRTSITTPIGPFQRFYRVRLLP